MARKRRRRVRRYRYKKSYRRKKKLPLIPLMSAVAIPFTPAKDGWGTPFDNAKAGNLKGVAQDLVYGFTPFNVEAGSSGFDLHLPRYLAMVIVGTVVSKVAGWLGANRMFQNAPSPFNKLKW